MIVDAKNAEYDSDIHSPYRRQIDDYMGYADAPIGVLIFSRGKEGLWDDLTTNEENILSLTTLIPSLTGINDSTNNTNLEKFIQLVESRGYRKKP